MRNTTGTIKLHQSTKYISECNSGWYAHMKVYVINYTIMIIILVITCISIFVKSTPLYFDNTTSRQTSIQ